jgi:gamma-glutamylcysteine synthetase
MSNDWYLQYVKGFQQNNGRSVGIEKEFPVVRKDDYLAFDVRKIFPDLLAMKGEPFYDDFYSDELLAVKMPDGVVITTDAGWGILEIALTPVKDVHQGKDLFDSYIGLLKDMIGERGGLILGYGIQPLQPKLATNWIKKRRHKIVCQNFGCVHDVNITITAGDQVHLSADENEIVPYNNVFNWPASLAVRERFWWFTPDNRHGVFPYFAENLEGLFRYIISLRHFISKNGKDYFLPRMPFKSFLAKNPEKSFSEELPALEGTMWYCARPRSMYGTIEIRPACCQPNDSALSLAAFCLGISERIGEAEHFIEELGYPLDIAREMREIGMTDALNGYLDDIPMHEICRNFLEISSKGLKQRGLGEEIYLEPLWDRVRKRKTLAEAAIQTFRDKGLPGLIDLYKF